MTEDEKKVAEYLLQRISAQSRHSEITSAIALYKQFIEACNVRERKLVDGWTELAELNEPDKVDILIAKLDELICEVRCD